MCSILYISNYYDKIIDLMKYFTITFYPRNYISYNFYGKSFIVSPIIRQIYFLNLNNRRKPFYGCYNIRYYALNMLHKS